MPKDEFVDEDPMELVGHGDAGRSRDSSERMAETLRRRVRAHGLGCADA